MKNKIHEKEKNTHKMHFVERAINIYNSIKEACSRPDKCVSGESLLIYNEINDWGFVDRFPILDENNKWLYVTIIAMLITRSESFSRSDSMIVENKGRWEVIQKALDQINSNKNA
jgi:hypothetical protein